MFDKVDVKYSSFSNRMIALAIDFTILSIVLMPVLSYLNYIVYGNIDFSVFAPDDSNKINMEEVIKYIDRNNLIVKYFLLQFFTATFIFLIVASSLIKFNNTPGKWIMGCRVLDAKTLKTPSKAQYIMRSIGYFVSGLPFCIGFFAMRWAQRSQCFHDKIAGTVVVQIDHDFSWLKRIKSYIMQLINKKSA